MAAPNTDIAQDYDEIAHCNKCGFCQVACPIFRSTGHESGVARGRLAMLRSIIEGRLDWSDDIENPLFTCLLCGSCTANCFPAIPTSDLVVKARQAYLRQVGRKPIHRLLFDQLLPYPRRLQWAARTVALGKTTGVSDLARAMGLLRVFGRNMAHAHDLMAPFPVRPLREKIKPATYAGQGRTLHIGYFVGCGMDCIQQQAGEATFTLLRGIARKITVLNNCCCGMPAWSYGDLEVTRKLAEKNVAMLSDPAFDVIVTDCSSCAYFLKKYGTLFNVDDPIFSRMKPISSRIKDLVELLEEEGVPTPNEAPRLRVTYHDSCHAVRGQQIGSAPRKLLARQPHVDLVEMAEADWCCGGSGSYALKNFELSKSVLDRKMANVERTQADTLVTSCPACMIQLAYGVRKHGLNLQVRHISQVLVSG